MSILWVKECISLLCRTCEPNIFVHLYTGYPFIGIFVNLDTRFVKSLGMLTSTALQACLIPFSSLFLFLPGPPETSYRFSLSGPLGWQSGIATHALRQNYSLISGWQLSVLKKKKKTQEGESESPSNSVFLPLTTWEFLSAFCSDTLLIWMTIVLLSSPLLLPPICGKCLCILQPSVKSLKGKCDLSGM